MHFWFFTDSTSFFTIDQPSIFHTVRNFIIFPDSKSALQAIMSQDWTHPLVLNILERLHWLVQYQEKRILFDWIPSHVGTIGNEKADTAAKAGLLRRVTNVPNPYGDLKKTYNVL